MYGFWGVLQEVDTSQQDLLHGDAQHLEQRAGMTILGGIMWSRPKDHLRNKSQTIRTTGGSIRMEVPCGQLSIVTCGESIETVPGVVFGLDSG